MSFLRVPAFVAVLPGEGLDQVALFLDQAHPAQLDGDLSLETLRLAGPWALLRLHL